MDLQHVRANIKKIIKSQGLTLNALSIKADLSEDTLRSLIYGKSQDAKVSTLISIADALDCSVDHLLGRDSKSASEENILRSLRALSPNSLHTVKALINLEYATTLHPSQKGQTMITVFILKGNLMDGLYYDSSSFDKLDISEYPESIKKDTAFGIKITTEHFEPAYHVNDILLLSQQRKPEYNDIVLYLDDNGRIFLRKYTHFGLEPLNSFGTRIHPSEMYRYKELAVVLRTARQFNIEQYR